MGIIIAIISIVFNIYFMLWLLNTIPLTMATFYVIVIVYSVGVVVNKNMEERRASIRTRKFLQEKEFERLGNKFFLGKDVENWAL